MRREVESETRARLGELALSRTGPLELLERYFASQAWNPSECSACWGGPRNCCVIPIEIEVENFLAYRTPGTLRLEGVHIACLAGPNGAGKSSLLDAITWVLWGKARSNSPDDLVHQGVRTMQVRLVFEHAGQRYQAIRQRKVGKQGASSLTLHAWDAANEAWRGLSPGRAWATRRRRSRACCAWTTTRSSTPPS